jgi:prepilin-type N-terminal cleavage/methylation domain-containing protein
MRIPHASRSPAGRRPGFTLIEMMVVIAIIAVLAAMAASGTMQFISAQKKSNTATTIQSVNKALDEMWRAVAVKANEENYPQWVLTLAGDDARRARVLWVKLRLKQHFPMNFTEALTPSAPFANTYPMQSLYAAELNSLGIANVNLAQNPPQDPEAADGLASESSVCLLMALTRGRGGANSFNPDTLGAGAVQDATYVLRNGRNITVRQIVDAWGHPIEFYRWPALNTELNPNPLNPNPGAGVARYRDTMDPENKLADGAWINTPFAGQFAMMGHNVLLRRTYNLNPVLISRGPNGRLGLARPTPNQATTPDLMGPISVFNDYADNQTSYRLREGARGD